MTRISPQKRHGRSVGYSVYAGVDELGRKQRRFFTQFEAAQKFVRVHSADPRPVGELLDRKAEILFCLEQLRPFNVSLPDVVAFYVRHHANKGNPTLSELVELFVAEKKRIGRSAHYEQSIRYYLNGFIAHIGSEVRISEITREQIADYVNQTKAAAGLVTKKNLITHLSVLFNLALGRWQWWRCGGAVEAPPSLGMSISG